MAPTHPVVRRPLTETELADIFAQIVAATTTVDAVIAAIRSVYAALLHGIGRPDLGFGPDQHIDPHAFAIPESQWRAILAVATNRAQEWGSAAELALELVNRLPATYDDPTVPTPTPDLPDRRPPTHQLHLTPDAVDVIAGNTRYLDQLATSYGRDAEVVRVARDSWYRHLTDLLVTPAGGHTEVRADGARSLLITTASGFTYAITFHPHPTVVEHPGHDGSAAPGPATVDNDEGAAAPHQAIPDSGVWVVHS